MENFEIKYNNEVPKTGSLLISEPFQLDYIFNRSVIMLCEHNIEGSFGVVLNKPSPFLVKDIVKELSTVDFPLFMGGPVDPKRLFYIHDQGDIIPKSVRINKNFFWGGDVEVVKSLMEAGQLSPHNIRFFLGYSGWDPKQLTEELQYNSWVVLNKSFKDIFVHNPSALWKRSVSKLGENYAFWKKLPKDPMLN
jgi:putative transcriptional regulator